MSDTTHYDLLVIGSGPAGQKAAIQGAKAGLKVAIVERSREVGGACVHRGTIPSKALQDVAVQLARLKRASDVLTYRLREQLQVPSIIRRIDDVVHSHVIYQSEQLRRNGVERIHGRARFVSDRVVEVQAVRGDRSLLGAGIIVVAPGSRPRVPETIAIDHDHVLDSDSILSLTYLPASLTVLGGGVVASEYASVFANLGVRVTLVDEGERPLGFLDGELTSRFTRSFTRAGGRYLGGRKIAAVRRRASEVVTELADGETVQAERLLVALGRVAEVRGLDLEAAGVKLTARGHIEVDASLRTSVPHIYAVGDAIGAPALASHSMEQGRRAVRHALGLEAGTPAEWIPIGIYTVPELAAVGLTEAQARERTGGCVVGRADFSEVARGRIAGIRDGLLKMVADRDGRKLLGVHVVGEGATEMIHLGQMALLGGQDVGVFIANTFNFPTLAEAYRVAALDVENRARAAAREETVEVSAAVS